MTLEFALPVPHHQIGLGLDSETAAPADTAITAIVRPAKPARPPRPHHASAAERERHRAFLETIDQPLWAKLEAHIVMRNSAPIAE